MNTALYRRSRGRLVKTACRPLAFHSGGRQFSCVHNAWFFSYIADVDCLFWLVVSPEPAQRIGQDGAAVVGAVEAVTTDELVVVAREGQRLRQRLVRQRPVAVVVVQIVLAILQEDADGPFRRFADHGLVIVTTLLEVRPVRDIREAAHPCQEL